MNVKLKAAIAATAICALTGAAAYVQPVTPAMELSPTVKVIMAIGHGSGVHIGNGYIITAGHVTEGQTTVTDRGKDGKKHEGEILWLNHASDVSLVHITDYEGVGTASLSCKPTHVGDPIRIEGNPNAVEFATTWGRVSAFGKTGFENLDKGMWRVLVTLDATAAPGVSGGPVYDGEGYTVRGILVSGMVTPRGTFAYAYMVPATEICRVMGR